MQSFRDFLTQKISYLVSHFQKNCILLDYNGNQLRQIDLSFDSLSDQYMNYCDQFEKKVQRENQSINNYNNQNQNITAQLQSININQLDLNIKLNDQDLEPFWKALNSSYQLAFNIEGQNISDQSILKLAELFQNQNCSFTKLRLAGNSKITQIGLIQLGHSLRNNSTVKLIDLHDLTIATNGINRIIQLVGVSTITTLDLGLITNDSLRYLAKNLSNPHKIQSIGFGQNTSQKWQDDGKNQFQNIFRRGDYSKQIISANIYPAQPINHYSFINQINIICKKNRKLRVDQRQNQFKAQSLNPNHTKYYDADNHALNAYKFSVKSYLNNVFGSLLDEALYFLQKQRRNSLRDQATFEVTQQPVNKLILQDICTADGSIIVLTKYLLAKIKQKQASSHGN